MSIWFTADTHFGHKNIIQYCQRPFLTTKEMDLELIRRWNEVVQEGDVVYHLGDFGFGNIPYFTSILRRLKGEIHLIRGNHDRIIEKKGAHLFASVDYFLYTEFEVNGKQVQFSLDHYGWASELEDAPGARRTGDYIWLFGHSHGGREPIRDACDVGVDCWDYAPVSLERAYERAVSNPYP